MARGGAAFDGAEGCGAARGFDASEATFNAALLREQYRALARLAPMCTGWSLLRLWRSSARAPDRIAPDRDPAADRAHCGVPLSPRFVAEGARQRQSSRR